MTYGNLEKPKLFNDEQMRQYVADGYVLFQPDVPDEALDDQRLLSAMSSDNLTVKTVANWVYSEIERVSKRQEAIQLGESSAR